MNRARRVRFSIGLVIVGLACGPASVASARVSAHCPAMRGEVVARSTSGEDFEVRPRALVSEKIIGQFAERAVERTKKHVPGNPLDPATTAVVLIEYQNDFTTEGGALHGAVAWIPALILSATASFLLAKSRSARPARA